MCVIITGTNKKPNLIELLAAEDQNPDGGGMAWTTTQGVRFRKGLTAEEIHEVLGSLPAKTRWVVHFRYATVGDPQVGLCHPFPIQRDTNLDSEGTVGRVLFHNGTVPDWKKKLKDITLDPSFEVDIPAGEWSDSRGVAWLLALNGSIRPLNFIEGKFIVLNRRGIKVFPEHKMGWTEQGGILYSNTYWRRRIPRVVAQSGAASRQETLPFLAKTRGSGFGRSLVDEVQDILDEAAADEAAAMDLQTPKPKAKAKAAKKKKGKKKKGQKRKPRKGLKLRQDR